MQIDGRTILVSGGASGLGGATAEMIVAAGGNVVIADVNEETGGRTRIVLRGAAEFVRTDVTSAADVERAVKRGDATIRRSARRGVRRRRCSRGTRTR
jgi:NAD(P)-dependent dehydrogenase (short-subunit alcohol dehydrogenase family)